MSTKQQFLLLCSSPLSSADFRLKLFGSTSIIFSETRSTYFSVNWINVSGILQMYLFKSSKLLVLLFKQCHWISPASYTFNKVWTVLGSKSQRQKRIWCFAGRVSLCITITLLWAKREILVSLTINDRPLKWVGAVPSLEICRTFLMFSK
jgi:hypothetical protein